MKKFFIYLSLLAVLAYVFWSRQSWFKSDFFRVSFFDVGQGDSALIVTPGGQTILIDGGPDNKVLRELSKVLPFWYRQIDLLVITHAHDDHITGLIEVLCRYKVKNILYNNLRFETPALNSLINIIKKNNNKLTEAKTGEVISFDNNCSISILEATKDIQKNDNDYSIVTMFNCLNKKVLFSGDAGEVIEKEILLKGINFQANIFKVSHHGSVSANSQNFLKEIKPQVAVISVGALNKFGHPSALIIDRLRQLPVDIYRTDKDGTVNFLANYKTIVLKK